MAQKRFDLATEALLESRDGALTKGGLITNGFAEQDGAGEHWVGPRPALQTGAASPFSGNALGMLTLGTSLYGVTFSTLTGISTGAVSWRYIQGYTPLVMDAGTAAGLVGYSDSSIGALSPVIWKNFTVRNFYSDFVGNKTLLQVFGTTSAGLFSRIAIGNTILVTAVATFGGVNRWEWPGTTISGTGITLGGFQ